MALWRVGLCLFAVGTLGEVGCNDGGVRGAKGGISTSPSLLQFGPVPLSQEARLDVQISNDGRAPFEVKALNPTVPGFAVEGVDGSFTLSSGQAQKVTVVFRPQAEGTLTGGIQIVTDTAGEQLLKTSGQGVQALVEVSDEALDFGSVELNSTKMGQVVLKNPTPLSLSLILALDGENASEFGSSLLGIQVVGPGQSLAVPLSFRPTQIGIGTARLTVGGCPDCQPKQVELSGTGISPWVSISPELLDFGRVAVGTKVEKKLTVSNNGTQTLFFDAPRIESDAASAFALSQVPNFPNGQLLPGETVEISVSFQPPSNGKFTGAYVRLSMRTSSRDGSVRIPLVGVGGSACVVVLPRLLDFGTVPQGMTVNQHVSVLNQCNQPVQVGDLAVSDAMGGYFSIPPQSGGLVIPPGSSAKLPVALTPKTGATAASANLALTAYEGASPYPFTVPMVAQSRAFAPCQYAVHPPALDFGGVNLGAQVSLAVAVENVGSDDCVISQFGLAAGSDPQFSTDASDAVAVKPGTSATFRVRFQPDVEGSFAGLAEGYLNHPTQGRFSADLSGQGVMSCFALQPSTVDFGQKKLSCGARTRVVVGINQCQTDVTLSEVALVQGTSSEFTIASPPPLPLIVQAGSQVSFHVGYQPVDDGADAVELRVNAGAAGIFTAGLWGAGQTKEDQTDVYVQASQDQVDVLFVMDNSGSMTEEQSSLGQNFAAFLKAAESQSIDYHIGVTTTGIEPAPGGWLPCPGGAQGGEAGRLFPADNSSPRIITLATPNSEAVFDNNVHVGVCHWDEQGLEAAYRALSEPLVHSADDPNTPLLNDGNAGFLRDGAKLSVIVISDEDDSSPQTVSFYETYFKSLKGQDPNKFSFSAIVGPADLSTCPTASGSGLRYLQLAQDTGGATESICTQNWAQSLINISLNVFAPKRRFPLTQVPLDASKVTVQVNGSAVTAGWTYDGPTNSVVFDSNAVPVAGSVVEITYPLGCN